MIMKIFEKSIERGHVGVDVDLLLELIDNCVYATDNLKLVVNPSDTRSRRKLNEANNLLSAAREIIAELNAQF